MPLASVITTTYNGRAVIGETIDSVLAQEFDDFEYVIVDDDSPDDTASLLRSYRDPRLRLIVNETNRGIAGARNVGLRAARGELLFMLDHDDIFLPGKIARQVAFMRDHPEVALCAVQHAFLIDGRQVPDEPLPGDPMLFKWTLLMRSPMATSSICLRRSFLEEHGLRYRQEWAPGDDLMFYNDVAERGIIAGLPELLTLYRYHGDNVSITSSAAMARRAAAVFATVYRRRYGLILETGDAESLIRVVTQKRGSKSHDELRRVGDLLSRLVTRFLEEEQLLPEQRRLILADAAARWWRTVERSAKAQGPEALTAFREFPMLSTASPSLLRRSSAWAKSRIGEARLARLRSFRRSRS